MKKLFIFGAATLLAISSCKKDDDNSTSSIDGTWKIDKHTLVYGNGQTQVETPNTCEAKTTLTFANGKVTGSDYYLESNVCKNEIINGTFTYANNKITINANGETNVFPVKSMTSSQLVLVSEEGDFDQDGKTDQYLIYFKK